MKIVIAGAGSVGRSVALELLAHGHDITLIDHTPEKLRISSVADADWVLADACSPDALRDAGVAEADVMVAATGDDKANLVISLLAKTEFAVPRVVARLNNPKNEGPTRAFPGASRERGARGAAARWASHEPQRRRRVRGLRRVASPGSRRRQRRPRAPASGGGFSDVGGSGGIGRRVGRGVAAQAAPGCPRAEREEGQPQGELRDSEGRDGARCP